MFQCGLVTGFFLPTVVWLVVGGTGPGAWRAMYLIGTLPALLILWIRRAIPESALWERRTNTAAPRPNAGTAALLRLRTGH